MVVLSCCVYPIRLDSQQSLILHVLQKAKCEINIKHSSYTARNKQPLIVVYYSVVTQKEIKDKRSRQTCLCACGTHANHGSLKHTFQQTPTNTYTHLHTNTHTHTVLFCFWASTLTLSQGGYK